MRTQALLNAKNAEYETAIANIYDYEKKLEAAKSAWENDSDGLSMLSYWKSNAFTNTTITAMKRHKEPLFQNISVRNTLLTMTKFKKALKKINRS